MGVVFRELPRMTVVGYVGFSPDPEIKAHDRMSKWIAKNGYAEKPHRNFGHDTDPNGKGYCNTGNNHNYGYKVMITVDDDVKAADSDLRVETFQPGKFVVVGIEGDIERDWTFIRQGWQKLQTAAKEMGHKVMMGGRCLEEKLEPSAPGHLRLDLYIEIE
ncbi:MAG: effector binding domain-containing protein [Spirochaetaceae bacterium]|nr:effector binding domain-containing protein [Spirochaetaceae bacterium]